MSTEEYLDQILTSQDLADDSDELKELQTHRADVEKLLRQEFSKCTPTIRYGGSKAKGTLNRESYDLDVICYFPNDDTSAGDSLKDIFENVRKALEKDYYVTPKTSSLRLKSKDMASYAKDFYIDVVPGRYVDANYGDCFIYQNGSEKERLKTNLDVHIEHVRDSGVVEAVRLLKLWKVRKDLPVRQFVWELLIIKLLKGKANKSLAAQLEHVWTQLRDTQEPISVEDPANPTGNDLSKLLDKGVWQGLSSAADATLQTIQNSGWEAVFGSTKQVQPSERLNILTRAAAAATVSSKPWSDSLE